MATKYSEFTKLPLVDTCAAIEDVAIDVVMEDVVIEEEEQQINTCVEQLEVDKEKAGNYESDRHHGESNSTRTTVHER